VILRVAITGSRSISTALCRDLLPSLVSHLAGGQDYQLATGDAPSGADRAAAELAVAGMVWDWRDLVIFGCQPRDKWLRSLARSAPEVVRQSYAGADFRQVADWDGPEGRGAGMARNGHLAEWAEAGVALWDGWSRGTENTISRLRAARKPVLVCQLKGVTP
jgi:hypothetical protein